jgi:hypothetical protein
VNSPCPKCGRPPSAPRFRHGDRSVSWWIVCRNHPSGERPSTHSFADQYDADEAWNRGEFSEDGKEPNFDDEFDSDDFLLGRLP